MERKTIPLDKQTVVDYQQEGFRMGPCVLDLPEGPALCHDAISTTQIMARREDGSEFIALISVANFDGRDLGVLQQFNADEARSLAASLLAAADQIGGAKDPN